MLPFFSEGQYERHKEHQREEALMLSVEEKKYPKLKDMSIKELLVLSQRRAELSRLVELRASVAMHRVYFDSFGEHELPRSDAAAMWFGSSASMLSELHRLSSLLDAGFAGVAIGRGNKPFLFSSGLMRLGAEEKSELSSPRSGIGRKSVLRRYPAEIFSLGEPLLAIDLYEHAYFTGYSFDKSSYISSALSRLRIDELDKLQLGIEKE